MAKSILTRVLGVITLVGSLLTGAAGDQSGVWQWPLANPAPVTRSFDPPQFPWLPGHRGVDLAAPLGSTVRSPAAGTVVYAGVLVDRGVVSIEHVGGIRSTYEPVTALVGVGTVVAAGDPIATIDPGHHPGTLHWGARIGADHYIDPLSLVLGPVALKPW